MKKGTTTLVIKNRDSLLPFPTLSNVIFFGNNLKSQLVSSHIIKYLFLWTTPYGIFVFIKTVRNLKNTEKNCAWIVA